jgi:hypothetical protein
VKYFTYFIYDKGFKKSFFFVKYLKIKSPSAKSQRWGWQAPLIGQLQNFSGGYDSRKY